MKLDNKLCLSIFCILSASLILLGLTYADNSSDNDDQLNDVNRSTYRVIYSLGDVLDTRNNKSLDVTLVNKKDDNACYGLYLKEVNSKEYNDLYYTIDDDILVKLEGGFIDLGELNEYTNDGDTINFRLTLHGKSYYKFYYSINEYKCNSVNTATDTITINKDGSFTFGGESNDSK